MHYPTDPDDALITDDILTAIFEQLPVRDDDDRTPAAGPRSSGEPAARAVAQLRKAVMAALATARVRRERHQIPPSEDKVLTAAEAAKRLGLSRFTLLRMRQLPNAGGLPFVKLSQARIGYWSRDVAAYLVAKRVGRLPDEPDDARALRARLASRRQSHEQPHAERSRHLRR
jgi:hypothetical protein